MHTMELYFRRADDAGQALEGGLDLAALAETGHDAEPPQASSKLEPDPSGDPCSLPDQGWSVIACRGEAGDRLLALAAPLVEKRARDQDAEVTIYRVRPGMSTPEAARWLRRIFIGNKLEEEIPGYVLIVGDFDQVSLELQQILSTEPGIHVGRLAFDRADQYEAYIAKLLRSERSPPAGRARSLFFTAEDGTRATALGHRSLMRPVMADALSLAERGRFPASEIVEIPGWGARAGHELLAAAADTRPSILFTCSHGLGPPAGGWPSPATQRSLQGALSLGPDQVLTGDRVADTLFLPDGIWLLFACFGAGTPAHTPYAHWLHRLANLGEPVGNIDAVLAALPTAGSAPFVAALPQAALANPEGPLAVIGHVDLAWSYSFQAIEEVGSRDRHRRFFTLVQQLARGSRAGLALSTLLRARERAKLDVAIEADFQARAEGSGYESWPRSERMRMGHRWMLHQDIDGYILLGDPAARLAIAPGAPGATPDERAR